MFIHFVFSLELSAKLVYLNKQKLERNNIKYSNKKIEIQMLYVRDVYAEYNIYLKKENISAALVIWIINKQCLEIPPTGYCVCFILFFNHDFKGHL